MTELETLAIVSAVFYFEYYLYGRPVTISTDHRACVSTLSSKHLNKRLLRFALKLQDRDITIKFPPGRLNGNADGLVSAGKVARIRDGGGAHPLGVFVMPEGLASGEGPVGLVSEKKDERKKEKTRKKEERRGPRTELNCCYYYACLLFCVTKLT